MHRVGSGVAIPKDFLGILYSIYNYFFSNKGNLVKVLVTPSVVWGIHRKSFHFHAQHLIQQYHTLTHPARLSLLFAQNLTP
jgi:hypothetical protein